VAIALLGLVGLLLLAVFGGYLYLSSRSGAERILRIAIASAQDAILGSLRARGLEFGGDRLVVHEVELRDPDGELVAASDSVEVRVSLLALIRRTLDLREVSLQRPRLLLKSDQRGLNLSRAIAPRHPSEKTSSGKTNIAVIVESLQLADGQVEFEQTGADASRHIRLEKLGIRGSATYVAEKDKLKADLELEANMTQPVRGPVSLKLDATALGEQRSGRVRLALAGLRLDADARTSGEDLTATVDKLEVPPAVARSFVPGYPILVPVTVTGEGARHENIAAGKVKVRAGSADLVAEGSFDLARLASDGITVQARGINLEQLVANGPASDLSLDAHASGDSFSLDALDGKLDLVVPAAKVRGQQVGPIHLRADARHGRINVAELLAILPGLKLVGSGSGTQQRFSFSANLTAADLSAFSNTLGGLLKQPPLQIGGSGQLELAVAGSTRHPALRVKGAFPKVRYESYAIQNLGLSATVPDLQKPLQSQLSVTASRVESSGKQINGISAQLVSHGREIELNVRSFGFVDLLVHAGGSVDSDNKGLLLNALQFEYPEAKWHLRRASHLRFGEELSAKSFHLLSGDQSLWLDGAIRGKQIRADLDLQRLDLSRLPKALVDPSLKLAGTLSAKVQARGRLPRPNLDARVSVDGRSKHFAQFSGALDARYQKDRASGKLAAAVTKIATKSELRAAFDMPIEALRTGSREPLHLSAKVDNVSLDDFLPGTGESDSVQGKVTAKVDLSGTANAPSLNLTVNGKSVRRGRSAAADVSLEAHTDNSGKLGSRLEVDVAQSKSTVDVRTALTLARLLRSPPSRQSMMASPLELDADIHDFPLALLHQAEFVNQDVRGALSLRAELRGSPRAPIGKVAGSVVGASLPGALPTDLSLVGTASNAGIQLSLNAQQQQRRLADVVASLQAPVQQLQSAEALVDVLIDRPLSIKATVGPILLHEVRTYLNALAPPSGEPHPDNAPQLDALLHADVSLTGTLRDPRLTVRSQLDQISADKVALGKANVEYSYASSLSKLDVEATSKAGPLKIQGQAKLDLSYPAIQTGLSYLQAPVDASLRADQFDLAVFSGALPQVRALGGKLDANANVQGTIGAPHVRGKLEWKDGKIAITGYGEYQSIHLLVEGTEAQVSVKELLARSGGGELKLKADAQRSGSQLALTGQTEMNKFPIISDDQLIATVSLRSTFEGEITPQLVNVRRVSIPEAHIELPDTKRKDLQKLDRPEDIVLVANGKPIEKAKYQKALAELGDQTGLGGAGAEDKTAAQPPQRTYVVTIDAPRNLWIKGNDLNMEVGLSDGFHVEYGQQPLVFGDVNVLRGRIDVLGRRLDVEKDSQVRFGGAPTTPFLNVTATYTNDQEHVKVTVTVRGEGKDLSIKTSSEPPLSESEIYVLLVTGHTTLKHNSGASASGSSQAASLLGSLAAAQLKSTLASKLPLDVISIEAGEKGLSKLEAGTYVSDKIYVGYTYRVTARPERGENANAVRLEYQLNPRWSIEGEYGDAKAGGLDLIWSKDY
jgi:translocation and assembly module TamB